MSKCPYPVYFPENRRVSQGQESLIVEIEGKVEEIRLQDYDRIYRIPWLYDRIFELLGYNSPAAICEAFSKLLIKQGISPSELRVLELGAGSGIVGGHLKKMGVGYLTGIDILNSAKEAVQRDKPGLYEKYYAVDLTQLPEQIEQELKSQQYNSMVVVSATGWDHISVAGLEKALEILVPGAWVIYHTKRKQNDNSHGVSVKWIDQMIDSRRIKLQLQEPCFHRYSINKEPIYYEIIIGSKK